MKAETLKDWAARVLWAALSVGLVLTWAVFMAAAMAGMAGAQFGLFGVVVR